MHNNKCTVSSSCPFCIVLFPERARGVCVPHKNKILTQYLWHSWDLMNEFLFSPLQRWVMRTTALPWCIRPSATCLRPTATPWPSSSFTCRGQSHLHYFTPLCTQKWCVVCWNISFYFSWHNTLSILLSNKYVKMICRVSVLREIWLSCNVLNNVCITILCQSVPEFGYQDERH